MALASADSSLSICLVANGDAVEESVRASCPPPNRISVFRRSGLVGANHTISPHGRAIAEAAGNADIVLIEWSFQEAPAINTLCYHIRKDLLAPILMICQDGPEAMTAGLAAGADDAVSLPIYLPYLQAKALSYWRLVDAAKGSHGGPSSEVSKGDVSFGPLRISPVTHRFYIGDSEVELTIREFDLLEFLIQRAETLCTRDQILSEVWGINFDTGTNLVDVYMHYLREKLGAHQRGEMIETVRGLGYRLVLPRDA